LQDLKHSMPAGLIRPIGIKPEGSKLERMAVQSAKIEAGQVHLPIDAAWLSEFLSELLAFPIGRHDDQVDSVSQFLCWWQKDRARTQETFPMPFAPSKPRLWPA
jgi:predicted phage terminase large subunit-like protein